MSQDKQTIYPHVFEEIDQWPIYLLSEDRKQFVQDIEDFTLQRLLNKSTNQVTDVISETIYLERIRMKEEPWKVDPPNERQFWSKIRKKLVKYSLDRPDADIKSNNNEILQQIIKRYAEEIVGTFRIKTFLFSRRFLTFFFNRLLQAKQRGFWRFGSGKKLLYQKLLVKGEVEKVRSLMKEGTVVIVPTHFSNLDSILIGYAMDLIAGLPSFSYGAGLNLFNAGYIAYFINRLGAYRVDRRKKNTIYLETLKAMSNLSIQRGTNSLFFPGGTRSRSGEIETKLKMGLLGTTVDAQRAMLQKETGGKKVFIVPLVLSYHFVLEAPFLIESYLRQIGKERFIKSKDDFYSMGGLIRFVWTVLAQGNDITLSFGQPMDVLGNPVDASGNSFDQYGNLIEVRDYFVSNGKINTDLQREAEYTKMLADKIVDRFYRDNIVLSSHLVAFAAFEILKMEHERLDLYGILRLPTNEYVFSEDTLKEVVQQLQERLFEMESAGEIKLSDQIRLEPNGLIRDGIFKLGNFHVSKPLKYNKKGHIISDNFISLYYYHNRMENYGLADHIKLENDVHGAILVD
jgi:glycerol-3-phosphate O-acyltransferase